MAFPPWTWAAGIYRAAHFLSGDSKLGSDVILGRSAAETRETSTPHGSTKPFSKFPEKPLQHSHATEHPELLNQFLREFQSMARSHSYSRAEKTTFGERFGMIVGGGAVLGLLTFQIIFVARLAGF
jgi:hypothetical protein